MPKTAVTEPAVDPATLRFSVKARAALAKYDPAACYLVGVSGGRDSMALLDFLLAQGFKNLVLCHLDHELRGAESEADARFVQSFAKRRKLKVYVETSDVAARAAEQQQSIEAAAREARYAFFEKIATAEGADTVFVAHHADDQVETFLFNLFRGAGSFGLGGMPSETVRTNSTMRLRILRPLLAVWRREIDEYVRVCHVKFREDPTNQSGTNTRSKMRHEIIPTIEKVLGRGIRKSIWQAAEVLRAQQEFMQASVTVSDTELSVTELRALPAAPQSLLIHQWLQKQAVPNLTFDLVQSVRALLELPAPRAKVNLPGNRHVRRRAKKLFVE